MLRVDVVVFCEVDNSWAHALLKSAGKLDPSLQRQTRCVSWHETCSHFLSSRGFVVECKCLSFLQASEWVTWNTLPQLLFFMRHTARISSDTSSYSTQTQRVFILSLSWHRHIHVRLIRCSRISKRNRQSPQSLAKWIQLMSAILIFSRHRFLLIPNGLFRSELPDNTSYDFHIPDSIYMPRQSSLL